MVSNECINVSGPLDKYKVMRKQKISVSIPGKLGLQTVVTDLDMKTRSDDFIEYNAT